MHAWKHSPSASEHYTLIICQRKALAVGRIHVEPNLVLNFHGIRLKRAKRVERKNQDEGQNFFRGLLLISSYYAKKNGEMKMIEGEKKNVFTLYYSI